MSPHGFRPAPVRAFFLFRTCARDGAGIRLMPELIRRLSGQLQSFGSAELCMAIAQSGQAGYAARSVEATRQLPHERALPVRRRPALTVASPPQSHRQTHNPSPAYRSVVSWPKTSPPLSVGEPGRDRHTRRCSRQPQSRTPPPSTVLSAAVTWPPHRHRQSHACAPQY
jgi:hypothetical protein